MDEEIEIELSEEDFCVLAHLAHEQDITFNQLIGKILKEKLDEDRKNL